MRDDGAPLPPFCMKLRFRIPFQNCEGGPGPGPDLCPDPGPGTDPDLFIWPYLYGHIYMALFIWPSNISG